MWIADLFPWQLYVTSVTLLAQDHCDLCGMLKTLHEYILTASVISNEHYNNFVWKGI